MSRFAKTLLLSILLVVAAVGGLAGYLAVKFVSFPASETAAEVIYEVSPQRSFMAIARDLETAGVVKNAQAFSIYARLKGERGKVKVGEYLLNKNMRPHEVLSVITSGKSIARPFTIAEGLNMFEIADLYEKSGFGKAADFLAVVKDPVFIKSLLGVEKPSLEGYLFPETYQVTKFTQTRELVAAMVRQYQNVYNSVVGAVPPAGWDADKILVLASIIEKETGAPGDRPLISSVFHNRLKQGMKLQTDPTIIYGIAVQTGTVPNNITRADLVTPTPYNTYVINGLPPGPISNPGRESLLAAIKPLPGDYLFFVSRGDGTTVFSKTLKEHDTAVKQFQMNPKALEGKSWRDLNKKTVVPPATN